MIESLLKRLKGFSPAWIFFVFLTLVAVRYVYVRIKYERKVTRTGGVHASKLASSPITELVWQVRLARAQVQHTMLPHWNWMFEAALPSCPNTLEANITGGQRFFFIRDPEHIKCILTGKFSDFGKGEEFHRIWEPFLGDSIFNVDHKQWQDSRNLIRPMFLKTRVSDLETIGKCTKIMMDVFPKPGQTFDLMDLFYRLTIDVTTEFLLGTSINSLQNPLSEFVKAFGEVQRLQAIRTVLSPFERLIPKGSYLANIEEMEKFIIPFIDRTLALDEAELNKFSKSEKDFSFLHALATYTRDRKLIRDQLVAVLLAGRDTTASTLSWAMYELAKPGREFMWTKLRREVLDTVGMKRPMYNDLKAMKYLNAILNETLRLYPAVPYNIRYALQDTTLPGEPGQPPIGVVKGDAMVSVP